MLIGERIRAIREAKHLTQGDIETRRGLRRTYLSRVENGHLVPAVATLKRIARALEVPLYQLFYEGKHPPKAPDLPKRMTGEETAWGSSGKEAGLLEKFRQLFARMGVRDRQLLLSMAQKMSRR